MRSFLPFLHNWNKNFDSFSVVLATREKVIFENKKESYLTLTTYATKADKVYKICDLDSGIDNLWGGVFDYILKKLQPLLNDPASYKWQEVKDGVLDYYHNKQKASVKEQKRTGAKTVWTPAGDFTLWQICSFLTNTLDLKHKFLQDRKLFSDLKKKGVKGFDKTFVQLVLQPIFEKSLISEIVGSALSGENKAGEIVNILVNSKTYYSGLYEDITDPEYKDPANNLLSREEQRELDALWQVKEAYKKSVEGTPSLSAAEKKLEDLAFWESPQGKQLDSLNRRRVYGGTLTFEQKEEAKRKRTKEVSKEIFNLLSSWGIEYTAILKGLDHYQIKSEFAVMKRWKKEKEFRQVMDRGKLQLAYLKEVVEGRWDSSSITLFGVTAGIALTVGFGIFSLAPSYKFVAGVAGAAISIIIYILLSKCERSRKFIVKLMKWSLR